MLNRKALIVIDVMNAIFELPLPLYKKETFLKKIENVIAKAHRKKALVIYIQHQGQEGTPFEKGTHGQQLHPILDIRDEDIIIKKHYSDSFKQTNLEDILRSNDINELYMCGFCTEGCVDETLRAACYRNFNVTLITDCHTTTDNEVLSAEKTIEYHNLLSKRYANHVISDNLDF